MVEENLAPNQPLDREIIVTKSLKKIIIKKEKEREKSFWVFFFFLGTKKTGCE